MLKLRLSEAARADTRAIYLQGVDRFGFKQADLYGTGLRHAIGRLAEFPESAPAVRGMTKSVRVLRYRSHIVVYTLEDGDVHILRVRHASEDWIDSPPGEHR